MEQLPTRIKTWLTNHRGISPGVIDRFEISWDGSRIVIPVHDETGTRLFNKYRRDPESSDGPKYQYEKGATSALFGLREGPPSGMCFIVEGELDCLRLRSAGFNAFTSTGGAGTFNEEWAKRFSGCTVYICLDTDDAGIKGAFHIQKFLPNASIIWLPNRYKDVTEFFQEGNGPEQFIKLVNSAKSYPLPEEWSEGAKKAELVQYERRYKQQIDWLMLEARVLRSVYDSDKPIQALIQIFMSRLQALQRQIKYFHVKRKEMPADRLQAAKTVPIPTFIKFNSEGNACCVWHKEVTPSMHWYQKQNRVKCFGCGKLGDVIDVVQQINGVGLPAALDLILKDNGKKA